MASEPSAVLVTCTRCTTAEVTAGTAAPAPARDEPGLGEDRRCHESCEEQCADVDRGTPSAGLRSKKPTGLSVNPV
jgi:hypothetical protein